MAVYTGNDTAIEQVDDVAVVSLAVIGKEKVRNTVMLFPKDRVWKTFREEFNGSTDDTFMEGRNCNTPK